MSVALTPPTPENVAEMLTSGDNDYHDGYDWKPSIGSVGNIVSIGITPVDVIGEYLDEVHFRAVVVEGDKTPVLLAGPAYVNGDDGYLSLRCDDCDGLIALVEAGDDLAGLNAKAQAHTCPPLADQGEAETR